MAVFYRQILPISLCYVLVFFYLRGFISGAIDYQLNLSARKKRRENQTFKEWVLYTRYRNEIPKFLLIWYFMILWLHPIALLFCFLLPFTRITVPYGMTLTKGVLIFDAIWVVTLRLLYWSSKPGNNYGRWIEKKRGMKKK